MGQDSAKLVIANWKMHGSADSTRRLMASIRDASAAGNVVVCPPATLLSLVGELISDTSIRLGGQDCYAEREGAFTGDISAGMLKDVGCSHVILGHSERRVRHHETSELVCKKAETALATGLIPVICVGESLAEREEGRAFEVVSAQIKASVPASATPEKLVIAYEPVWAIGTGKVASVDDIAKMHTHIRSQLAATRGWGAQQVKVVYGGSVKATNAVEIMEIRNVAGVLVGGASLVADEFLRIIAASQHIVKGNDICIR